MIVLQIVMCILLAAVFVYWARFFVIHWKAKEFFWRFMPEDDKAVVNYGWHRPKQSVSFAIPKKLFTEDLLEAPRPAWD